MSTDELELLQGTLDLLVLRALMWGPMHGYGVVRFIRSGSNGAFDVNDGALYTCLHRLEERGLVEAEWGLSDLGKRARFYSITATGRRSLRSNATMFERYVTAVQGVMSAEPRKA